MMSVMALVSAAACTAAASSNNCTVSFIFSCGLGDRDAEQAMSSWHRHMLSQKQTSALGKGLHSIALTKTVGQLAIAAGCALTVSSRALDGGAAAAKADLVFLYDGCPRLGAALLPPRPAARLIAPQARLNFCKRLDQPCFHRDIVSDWDELMLQAPGAEGAARHCPTLNTRERRRYRSLYLKDPSATTGPSAHHGRCLIKGCGNYAAHFEFRRCPLAPGKPLPPTLAAFRFVGSRADPGAASGEINRQRTWLRALVLNGQVVAALNFTSDRRTAGAHVVEGGSHTKKVVDELAIPPPIRCRLGVLAATCERATLSCHA